MRGRKEREEGEMRNREGKREGEKEEMKEERKLEIHLLMCLVRAQSFLSYQSFRPMHRHHNTTLRQYGSVYTYIPGCGTFVLQAIQQQFKQ